MISYLGYKVVHLLGIFLVMVSLGALSPVAAGGGRSGISRLARIAHGIGLLVVLVAGFGLIARLAFPWPWPVWIWLKLFVWVLLGGVAGLVPRAGKAAGALLYLIPVLGAAAAYLAIYKVGG
jgi:hypothetical protein